MTVERTDKGSCRGDSHLNIGQIRLNLLSFPYHYRRIKSDLKNIHLFDYLDIPNF